MGVGAQGPGPKSEDAENGFGPMGAPASASDNEGILHQGLAGAPL